MDGAVVGDVPGAIGTLHFFVDLFHGTPLYLGLI
jgi:hypothetical protein